MKKRRKTAGQTLTVLAACAAALMAPAKADVSSGGMNVFYWSNSAADGANEAAMPACAQTVHCRLPEGFLQVYNVSDSFHDEIVQAANSLPQAAVNALSKAGYKIELSRSVPDAVPWSRHQQVRGYAPHATWNDVFGMFNRTTERIIMAQFAQLPKAGDTGNLSELQDKQRRLGILRHEFGHALDEYLGNCSHSQPFKQIYDKEKLDVASSEQKTLAYYLQPGDAGREETFAELFAASDDQGCDRVSDRLLQKRFPRLGKLIAWRLSLVK